MSSTFSEAQHDYIHDILWGIRCRRVVDEWQGAMEAASCLQDPEGVIGDLMRRVPQEISKAQTLNRIMTEYLTGRN